MNLFKSIKAWFAGLFHKEPTVADETVLAATPAEVTAAQVATVLDANPATTVVITAAPVAPAAPAPVVDTDKLKALLITLGHDVKADWEHLVALVTK